MQAATLKQMKSSIQLVLELQARGVLFVPMPVLDNEDHRNLLDDAERRILTKPEYTVAKGND